MKCVHILRLASRKAQISDLNPYLSVNRQLKLLQVPLSGFCYKNPALRESSRTASDERFKDKMLEIYMETPFLVKEHLSLWGEMFKTTDTGIT